MSVLDKVLFDFIWLTGLCPGWLFCPFEFHFAFLWAPFGLFLDPFGFLREVDQNL